MARNHITTSATPLLNEQVQYTEPLPAWLEREVEAGMEHLPKLRAALCRAQLKSKGLLKQHLKNKEQNYTYTGFAEVLESVREAMASEGLSVDQVTCDIEEELHAPTQYNSVRTLWKWRCVCLVTHQEGAALVRIIRTLTSVGDKAAGAARTQVDRTLLMTTMRIAGAKDEPAQPEEGTRSWREGPRQATTRERLRPQQGTQHQARPRGSNGQPAAPEGQAAGLKAPELSPTQMEAARAAVDELIQAVQQVGAQLRLVSWARVVLAMHWPPVEHERAVHAIKLRARAIGADVKGLLESAKRQGPLPQERIVVDPESGDWSDRDGGELL